MSNIFHFTLIALLCLFILLLVRWCSNETPEQLRKRADVLEQKDASKKMTITSNTGKEYNIIKIKNHEYLEVLGLYCHGICHYQDCEYCLKNKSK